MRKRGERRGRKEKKMGRDKAHTREGEGENIPLPLTDPMQCNTVQ